MRNPYLFQTIIAAVLLLISAINLFVGKNLLALALPRLQIILYLTVTAFMAFGMFSIINALPFAAQISRFCVFWFVAQIIVLPFALILFLVKMLMQNLSPLTAFSIIPNTFLLAVLAAFCLSAYGAYYESVTVKTVHYDIPLQNLDPTADGFKIAQLTDLHIGHYFSLQDLRGVMQKTVAEQPDVLVITGDLIDDVAKLQEMVTILNAYAAQFPYGIYYCWGNHEYFRNYGAISSALSTSEVHVLKNQHALLRSGQIPLYILGIDYSFNRIGGANQEYDAMLEKALTGVGNPATKILLSHHSMAIDNAFAQQIDLTLTGHTHGLQVGLVSKLFHNAFKYMRGMYKQGELYGYVGTGVSGWFPFRLGCPPEIAIFTLKKS